MFGKPLSVILSALALTTCTSVESAPPQQSVPPFSEWQDQCNGKDGWTDPGPPFHVFGNTYYVGTCGITALLVTAPDGHVLLDSGMTDAAPLVAANIERLGFRLSDVKWLLSSHEHLDHVGATAELKRLTGAQVVALEVAKQPLESGKPYPEDPQAGIPPFEGFTVDRTLADGETLAIGGLTITAHSTPAHTPGSTSWTWQSCENGTCRTIAYADSITTPAAEGYRFSDHPDYVAKVRTGFDKVEQLDCGILLTPHPGASGMKERLAGERPLTDPAACAAYAEAARARFERLLLEEACG
jgi:metallo-beta-lactamase class B